MALSKWEQEYYDEKGIKKKDLKDGAYYRGHCRNASIARYNAKDSNFYYIRSKFGSEFVESLPGPEDEVSGLDFFMPEEELANPPFEIKFEG